MEISGSGALETRDLEIRISGDLGIWRSGDVEIWRSGDLEMSKCPDLEMSRSPKPCAATLCATTPAVMVVVGVVMLMVMVGESVPILFTQLPIIRPMAASLVASS